MRGTVEQAADRLQESYKGGTKNKSKINLINYLFYRYISNPLLLEGRKFDIRAYMLLTSTEKSKILAFYRDGYIRLSCLPYDADSSDMTVHLTNQFVQKKHPSYQEVKEDTVSLTMHCICKGILCGMQVWDFAKFQSYMTEKEGVSQDWVATTLTVSLVYLWPGKFSDQFHYSVR